MMRSSFHIKKVCHFLLFAFFIFPCSISAETIYLKSGKKIEAKILEKKDQYITVDLFGVTLKYFNDEIEKIDENKTLASETPQKTQTNPLKLPPDEALSKDSGGGATQAEKLFNEGVLLYDQGELDKAIGIFRRGIESYPTYPAFYAALGNSYYEKTDFLRSVDSLLKAYHLYRDIPDTPPDAMAMLYYTLIGAYIEIGKQHGYDEELCLRVIYYTEKLLEIVPDLADNDDVIGFIKTAFDHLNTGQVETKNQATVLSLPSDDVSREEKLSYKEKAWSRIQEPTKPLNSESFEAVNQNTSEQAEASP